MPPTVNDNFRNTNITSENIVMPEILEKYPNPNIMDMVVDYGIQITMYPFYKYSDEVIQYELLFNEYKTAFVPMAYAIKYLERMRTDLAAKNMQLGAL
jgi:hypothetical protein